MFKTFYYCLSALLISLLVPVTVSAAERVAIELGNDSDGIEIDFKRGREILDRLDALASQAEATNAQGEKLRNIEAVKRSIKSLRVQLERLEKLVYRNEANVREVVLRSMSYLDAEELLLGGTLIRELHCPISNEVRAATMVAAVEEPSEEVVPLQPVPDQQVLVPEVQLIEAEDFTSEEELIIPEVELDSKQVQQYLSKVEKLYNENKNTSAKWILQKTLDRVPLDADYSHQEVNNLGIRLGKARRDQAALEVFLVGYEKFKDKEHIALIFLQNVLIQYIQLEDREGFCRVKALVVQSGINGKLARYYDYFQCGSDFQ